MKLNRKLIRKMILKEMADMGMGMPPERPMVNPQVVSAIFEVVRFLKEMIGRKFANDKRINYMMELESLGHQYRQGLHPGEILRFLNTKQPPIRSPKFDGLLKKLHILLKQSL